MRIRARKRIIFLPIVLLTLSTASSFSQESAVAQQGWKTLPAILKRIVPPTFPNRDYDITTFGAVGDGVSDCSAAIARAIEKCSREGGGRVLVPKGTYLSGAIHLKSNVNLHITKEATIRFGPDPGKLPSGGIYSLGRD